MSETEFIARRAIVFVSALVYWAGVMVQARRIRKQIGRSPNVKPRGRKEKALWLGWFAVIVVWLGQPFWVQRDSSPGILHVTPGLLNWLTFATGLALVLAGYAATLWCYAVMGDAWRMGINKKEKNSLVTQGPYRAVRHPIYLFQIVMLTGVALLLPTAVSLVALILHSVCVLIKAIDEEVYLRGVHGQQYDDYLSRTGRLFPRMLK
jgi:protein-S-isoprenylcysteine O-methyltransferase Ste14